MAKGDGGGGGGGVTPEEQIDTESLPMWLRGWRGVCACVCVGGGGGRVAGGRGYAGTAKGH